MLTQAERKKIITLIKQEVVPAIGCTEPVAVALCVAKATETLGCCPEQIEVLLSANILKNAMGVGIPGTDMIGLPIAIALGALIGHSEYGLEVLKETTPEAVEAGKRMIDEHRIQIRLKEDMEEKLYIEAHCQTGRNTACTIIAHGHTEIVYVRKNDQIILDRRSGNSEDNYPEELTVELSLQKTYDFATTAPLDEIDFILETKRLNMAAAESAFGKHYGHELGRVLRSKAENRIMGDTIFARILSYTSAACDARMSGAQIPVMSNSGSGNQGIAATLPVVVFAQETGADNEQLTRALMLSHLTVIYIKQSLGRLSALCGCVVAATGSSCGITYLMGGQYREVAYAVQNMIANLTGMICDGAKPSCALKLTSGVSTAVLSAILAMEQKCVTAAEGIIDDDVDRSIRNLTAIGSHGMCETDRMVLNIMTHKGQ